MTARKVAPLHHWLRLSVLVVVFALALAGLAAPSQGKLGEINFVNAEVPVVMKALADMSGTNIVVAPTIKGQITVRLKDVTLEEALQIITNLAGLSYANTNNTYVISPKGSQSVAPVQVVKGDEANLIYTLKAVTAEQAAAAMGVAFRDVSLKPVGADRLVLNGEKNRLQVAKAFLEELDVPTAVTPAANTVKVTETGEVLYNLKSAVSWQAKKYLEELYGREGLIVSFAPTVQVTTAANPTPETAGGTAAPAAGLTWASDKLVLRGPKPVVEKALSSLQVVDVDVPLVEKRCNVKRIYASQAIAYLLERFEQRGLVIFTAPMTYVEIASKDSTAKDASAAAAKSGQIGARVRRDDQGKLNVAEPIGDFIVRGPGDVVREALASLETIDIGPQRLEKIYTLRFLDAQEAEKQIEDIYGTEGLVVTMAPNRRGTTPDVVENDTEASVGAAATAGNKYLEVFDLVLRGPEGVVARAVQLLDTLDVAPPQVRISTEIVSVSMDETKNLGINWGIQPSTRIFEAAVPDNPLKFGRFTRSAVSDISATLNLLESNNKAKIISRPSTVVQNGREAFIHVGEKVYYQTVVSISDSGAPLYSTESIDTGVTMKVRPIMSRDGSITLEFTTNVTGKPQLLSGVANSTIPRFTENSSTTVLQVREGETMIIGGLIQSVDRSTETRVPGISRIPLIGKLFRNKEVTPERSELLIMVTASAVVPVTATIPAAEAPATTPAPVAQP